MLADDFSQRKIRIIERVFRIDDTLFRCIVKSLRLIDVAARADTGLLTRFGLVQKRAECLAFGGVGRELIGCRQDSKVGLGHAEQ